MRASVTSATGGQLARDREAMFPPVQEPGTAAQSDTTQMTGLNITVARVPFPTWFCPEAAQFEH